MDIVNWNMENDGSMTFRNGIFILLIFFLIGCRQIRETIDYVSSRPNVLLIFTDQQSFNAMSVAGNQELSTPSMDYLAMHGVMFPESYCTSPVCSPSRSSIITGRMPHETGVNWNGNIPNQNIPNMGQIFTDEGYNTYWAGKWHLPESYPLRSGSKDRSIPGFKVLQFYDTTRNWPEWGLGDTTDSYLSEAVVQFIEGYEESKPFMMAVSFCNPHDICYVPRRPETFSRASEINELPELPENFEIPDMEPEIVGIKRIEGQYGIETTLTRNWTEEDWRAYRYHYFRMTERVDREIGKILQALQKNSMLKNTLIVFTSDHGDGQGAHRWAVKLSFYEEASKVPLIISWQGVIPQNRILEETITSGIDILPTLLDYSGIEPKLSFTGRSLRPTIEQKDQENRHFSITELADDPKDTARIGRMIRTDHFKYCLYSEGQLREQFFDLETDPGEMNNLIGDNTFFDEINKHRQLLSKWMEHTNDKKGELLLLK